MEWSVGADYWSGVFEWSGVKFWSKKVGYFAIHSDNARPYFRRKKNNINFHSAGVGVNINFHSAGVGVNYFQT